MNIASIHSTLRKVAAGLASNKVSVALQSNQGIGVSSQPSRHRAVWALILGGAVWMGCGTDTARADDWPQWRGPNRNGISQETGWNSRWSEDGLKTVWQANVGIGFSSFAVAQGKVFTLGFSTVTSNDNVYCFDEKSGKELWKVSYPSVLDDNYYEGGPGATPAVDGQQVYSLSKRGLLMCLDVSTGKQIWQRDVVADLGATKPEWGFAGSPVVDGDRILLNVGDAGAAVAKLDGKVLWTSGTNVAGYSSPVVYGSGENRSAVIFSSSGLVSVRVSDGKRNWHHPWEEEYKINAADPILLSSDSVYISSYLRGNARLQFTDASIAEVWTNKNLAVGFNSCVLVDGYIYGVHGTADRPEKEVRCVDAVTGALKWKHEGFGLGSVVASDKKLILLSEKGELHVAEASPEGFKVISRSHVLGGKCWTTPVLANGRIYCRNAKGKVVCLDVSGSSKGSDGSAIPVNAREKE